MTLNRCSRNPYFRSVERAVKIEKKRETNESPKSTMMCDKIRENKQQELCSSNQYVQNKRVLLHFSEQEWALSAVGIVLDGKQNRD